MRETDEGIFYYKIISGDFKVLKEFRYVINLIFFIIDTLLMQQVDFLETILEETSDDLQSDSDRSGTTYWLGSDSETESVIHIKSNQRAAGT